MPVAIPLIATRTPCTRSRSDPSPLKKVRRIASPSTRRMRLLLRYGLGEIEEALAIGIALGEIGPGRLFGDSAPLRRVRIAHIVDLRVLVDANDALIVLL